MNDDLFDGIWVFDREASTLGSMAPVAWIQSVYVEGDRIRVKEEIRRGDSWATVEVEGKLDGHYYPVVGSPFTDDMCFVMEGECIRGVARKNGVVAGRDRRDFSEPGTMRLEFHAYMEGKEISSGTAVFRKQAGAVAGGSLN
jgi:hypothetical protein